MMNRREWLRNAALLAVGAIAVDQLELLDRLAPRRLWAGADLSPRGRWMVTEESGMLIPDGGYEVVHTIGWVPTNPALYGQLRDLYRKTNTYTLPR